MDKQWFTMKDYLEAKNNVAQDALELEESNEVDEFELGIERELRDRWIKEGRCPVCGEKGKFDQTLYAKCSKHGTYI